MYVQCCPLSLPGDCHYELSLFKKILIEHVWSIIFKPPNSPRHQKAILVPKDYLSTKFQLSVPNHFGASDVQNKVTRIILMVQAFCPFILLMLKIAEARLLIS